MDQKVIRSKILIPFLEDSYREEYTEYARRNLRCSDSGASCDEGEKCEREIFYDMTIPEKKTLLSSGTLVLFDDGRIHEQDIRRRLRLVLRSPERELKDDEITINGRPVSGKIDNMVDSKKIASALDPALDKDLQGDPVLEIKSANEFSYQMMAREGKINQAYEDQIQEYLFLSKAKWAICLIKNRNSSGDEKGVLPYLEFIVLSDPERQAMIRAGLKTTAECVEKNILPPRPFLRESTKCSYCRFWRVCWGPPKEKPEAPAVPIEEGPAPDQEMVESALKVYASTKTQIDELEKIQGEAKSVLSRFFRATKLSEAQVENIKATYSTTTRNYIDKLELLKAVNVGVYARVSEPVNKLLEQAVKDRLIDAKVIDDVTKPGKTQENLRVTKIKDKAERVKNDKKKQVGPVPEGNGGDKPNKKRRAPKPSNRNKKGRRGAKSKRMEGGKI